jgi:hypothetical protein
MTPDQSRWRNPTAAQHARCWRCEAFRASDGWRDDPTPAGSAG